MQEVRQRKGPDSPGAGQQRAAPRAPAAPQRRPRRISLPLLGAIAVGLLAFRLGARVIRHVQERHGGGGGGGEATPAARQQDGAYAVAGRVFSKAELAAFDGSGGGPLYVAILGDVFDVSSKPQFYAKGEGYHHFVGADGTRAFITGEFESEPDESVVGLTPEEVHGIVGWRDFYFKNYPHVGRVVGLYYSTTGEPTAELRRVEAEAVEGERLKEEAKRREEEYLSCGMQYTAAEGGKVWCDGGLYPRKLFKGMDDGSASWHCVCMEGIGWSDLLQVYKDCAPDAHTCVTSPPAAAEAA